jgi:hypothetical protein
MKNATTANEQHRMSSKMMEHGKKHHPNSWNPLAFPFKTNYNDHFETPFQAYVDIKPVLEWLCMSWGGDNSTIVDSDSDQKVSSCQSGHPRNQLSPNSLILYDPYYCNGRTATFLKQLGYNNVVHEKRDFYIDIRDGKVPSHNILITNPPFSDSHKSQCLSYCFRQLRKSGVSKTDVYSPFLLLMPTYTAAKQYYRERLTMPLDSIDDVVYLIPTTTYKYDHPEHTGKEYCPFESLWFLGIGKDRVDSFQKFWQSISTSTDSTGLTLATSIKQLEIAGCIRTSNRPNPKQRNRIRKRLNKEISLTNEHIQNTSVTKTAEQEHLGTSTVTKQRKKRKSDVDVQRERTQIISNGSPNKQVKKRY